MDFSEKELAFLEKNHAAAMTTVRADGTLHTVRVGVALVEGKLWSSGVPSRLRTTHLRRDPRSSVMIWEAGYGYLTVESRVNIIDGPQGPEMNLRLFQVMQSNRPDPDKLAWWGKQLSLDEFLETMRAEQRLIYEFLPLRTYGLN